MDFVIASAILNSVRDTVMMLLSAATEPLSLAVWGCGLLAVSATVRSLAVREQAHRFDVQESAARALTDSRA
jgi:hypothetical protein